MLNKAIISADHDSNGRQYKGNLCFFRALAYFHKQEPTLAQSTIEYFETYLQERKMDQKDFKGVPLTELAIAEQTFTFSIR
ncbi:hypothetical protein EB796_015451 [Bugula neritina]|uniref:Uncharacterized protein n=1 Tax=Bugula neritina TaxID=10212 RepID=A0A7J7JJG7_BUGNE|nr:hypothetical protein EB796_015451 [Bugula neritina]